MKKNYDWSIRLLVLVSNSQRKIELVTSVHTNIHQLKIEICKILNLSILDTHLELFSQRGQPMKATSTLQQNQITKDASLTATVTRSKPVVRLPVEDKSLSGGSSKMKGNVENAGLTIVSSCTSPKCVNYNQKIEMNLGFGDFPILELTSMAKCEICPYKSQFLRPNMMCHQVRVERCLYQLKGTSLNSCGIPVPHQTGYLKTMSQKGVQKLLADNPWHMGMQLLVKCL